MSNGDTEMRASSNYNPTYGEEKFCGAEKWSSVGTKNERGKFVYSAGIEFNLKENAKHMR